MTHYAATGPQSATGQQSARLQIVLLMLVGFMAVELVAGIASGSLALIADAAHMGTGARS